MDTEYRQRTGKDTWHYRPDCSNWPRSTEPGSFRIFEAVGRMRPPTGELCNECQAKEARERHPSGQGGNDGGDA